MYIYIYLFIYLSIYYICIHTYTHTYIYTYTHTHISLSIYIHTHTHTSLSLYIYIYIHTYIIYIDIYIYIYIYLCIISYLYTLHYEVSKIPPGDKSHGSRMGIRFNSRPLTTPHCRRPGFWILELLFLRCNLPLPPTSDIYGSCGSRYLEWCPLFWTLSKVPGILVIGKRTILGVGFLRVSMALYGYSRH